MSITTKKILLATFIAGSLSACSGDDGKNGSDGSNGTNGSNGLVSLLVQSPLTAGHEQCFKGGLQIDSGIDDNSDGMLSSAEIDETSYLCSSATASKALNFNRIASFTACLQNDTACDDDNTALAEISTFDANGESLIYTDSAGQLIGFVDISNPNAPQAAGTVAMGGEPTSVASKGDFILAAVNTSADFVNVSGKLVVLNSITQTEVRSIDLGGQPDSIAVSPDGTYAAIVIENERDEELGDGAPPQMPAGELLIANIADTDPANWTISRVALNGLADLYPNDPEPEYVDINSDNIAVLSMQENNHLVLVDLSDGSIVNHFSAGSVNLTQVDATEEDTPIVSQTESVNGLLREPDGVAWINRTYFATANEGDLDGGSRSFSIFNTAGEVVFDSGNEMEHLVARFGHLNEARSANKGNEPENVEVGIFGGDRYLFVNSERSSLVFVYDINNPSQPVFKQVLPAMLGPEGVTTFPARNLLAVSSEEDERGLFRGGVNFYRYDAKPAQYPSIASSNRLNGTPIPWAALSGLAAHPSDSNRVYSIEDSAFASSRIFAIDIAEKPARLLEEIHILDSNDVFATTATLSTDFDAADRAAMINADSTLNLDPEGIALASDGGFWVASEGAGTVGDASRPVTSLNFILKTSATGIVERVIGLPTALNNVQLRFGFEGVSEYNGKVYVAFQRTWPGDAANTVRIGAYDLSGDSWEFYFYTLDNVESPNGGWVGLSELTSLGDGRMMLVERDNQMGPDARVKRLYVVDISAASDGSTLLKSAEPLRNILPDISAFGNIAPEKIEGAAVLANGEVVIVNDNDGVDDNNGETQLINLGKILD